MCFRDSKDFLPMEFNYTSTHLQTSVHWELCIPPSFWSLNAMQVPNCALRTVVTGRELDPVMSVTAQTISVSRTVWVTFVNNETTMLSREMQRNTKKCREIQRNAAKFREMQICRDILEWTSWPLWPSWHTGMSYLISLNPLHLENTAQVGSYRYL